MAHEEVMTMNEKMNLFLGVITILFLIGLVVMIYILSFNAIKNASSINAGGQLVNETILFSNSTCVNTSVAGYSSVQLSSVVIVDINGTIIPPSSYTIVGGCIQAK